MIAALKITLLLIQMSNIASPTHLVVNVGQKFLITIQVFRCFFHRMLAVIISHPFLGSCYLNFCFSGLNLHPGSRRKSKYLESSEMSDNLARLKRLKQISFSNSLGHFESDSSGSMIDGTSGNQDGMNKHTTHNCLHTSPCAVEG